MTDTVDPPRADARFEQPEPSRDELVANLPPAQAEAISRIAAERANLFVLHEALVDVERATTLEARLRIFVDAIRKIGFGRVALTLRDPFMNPTMIVTSGLSDEEARDLRAAPAPGSVWRRRMSELDRFKVSQSYYLDGRDAWVAREFRGGVKSALAPGDDPGWSPTDTLIVPVRAADGRILATLLLDEPQDRRRPSLTRVRIVELFGQQVAYCVEQAQLVELAHRRASLLQRLHETGAMLSRTLEEREIVRELARQVARLVPADGVVIAHPDLEAGRLITALRMVHGVERPRPPRPLGRGAIGEAARTGRPVRVSPYEADRTPLAAADDVVGDAGPASSVLAVPVILGTHLLAVIAVHARNEDAFGLEEEEVMLTVASQAAAAMTNARLYAESQRERRTSEALADVARAVSEAIRLQDVLRLILRHTSALLRTEGACVSLRTEKGDLEVVATVGSADVLMGVHLPLEGSVSGRVAREGTLAIVNDLAAEADAYAPSRKLADIRKTVIVPLFAASGPIGVLTVINRDQDFTEEDARTLQRLADQVAVAIVNARLFEELAGATREWSVAFDAVPSGMVVLDASGRITRANALAAKMAGVDHPDALAGRVFSEALELDPLAPGEGPVDRALGGAQRTPGTLRGALRGSRGGRILDVRASPHPGGGAVITFDDVTAHHLLAERHRRVVETVSDAIVITDVQRRVAFCNPAAFELFGAGEEIIGQPVSRFVPPEVAATVRSHEDRAFAGAPQHYETELLRVDGERRIVAVSTAPLLEVGQITGVVASLRDVTRERRARDAVAESEARYRNLFESATDAIYTLDPRGIFTSVNDATCRMTGRSRDELLAREIAPLLDPDELETARAHFKAALGGTARHFECFLIQPSGARRLMSVTNTPIRVGRGVVGVLGIARDVTEERERVAALARSEARYERLVESASDAIFTVDPERRLTSVNRALELSVGRSRDELLGQPFIELVDVRDREAITAVLDATLTGSRQRGELRYPHRRGDARTASILTTPIFEGEAVVGALGIVRDVTEERRLAGQLLQQEKLAAIGQLVSGVAHELNNPLAAVMAYSQLLLKSPEIREQEAREVETIHQEAKRAAKIVSNLLTFARQHPPERTAADVNRAISDTVELRRYALRMAQVEVEMNLDENLPLTWADPFQLQQVMLNLVSNAEQALVGWQGERRIRISSRFADEQIVVTIADSGPGIPQSAIPRLFNPFFTTKPVGQGTGLGLSISDGIVREHGGRIRVESPPSGGASFIIELPYVEPPILKPRTPAGEHPAYASPQSVLVVDDEPAIRSALTRYLSGEGHDVASAGSGTEALAALAERHYDAILLDLRMPDMSGDAVFAELRARDPKQAERVIFVTGDVQSSAARASIEATGRPWLHKPFLFDELALALRKLRAV